LVVQLFVITGIPIALQKFVAENTDGSRLFLRKTLPVHLINSCGFFILFWLLAPVIANLFDDQRLEFFLKIAGIDIIAYGLYKYYVSMQNGLHQFGRQTISGIAYAIAKPVAIFALVLAGFSVTGAVIGNMLGSVGGFFIGVFLIRYPELKGKIETTPFFKFAFTNVWYFVGLQLLFSIDIWFAKYYLSDEQVGFYTSASSIAKIPYLLSLAVSAAMLPAISRSSKANDDQRVRDIASISLRYWFMLLFAMILVVGSSSESLIRLFFGEAYLEAAPILAVLFAGVALITFAAVMNTVLIARDQLKACLATVGSLIAAHVVACFFLVPRYGGLGAGYATLIVAVIGIVLSGALLLNNIRVVMSPLSALRTAGVAALVFFLGNYFSVLDHHLIGKSIFVSMVFVSLLFLVRELNVADLKRFRTTVIPGK
jgi:O-antigen/teichoic acid export membrane protein